VEEDARKAWAAQQKQRQQRRRDKDGNDKSSKQTKKQLLRRPTAKNERPYKVNNIDENY
jgi:hypothetical protein